MPERNGTDVKNKEEIVYCDECKFFLRIKTDSEESVLQTCGHPDGMGYGPRAAVVVTPGKPSIGLWCPLVKPVNSFAKR